MKNKKWLLLLIILFPSTFWIILELSTINSKKLPFFGPKLSSGTDTTYYTANDLFFWDLKNCKSEKIKGINANSSFCLIILNEKYKNEGYRLGGLLEYTQYKFANLVNVPIVVLGACDSSGNAIDYSQMFDLKKNKDISMAYWPAASYDSLTFSYFK